MKNLKNCRVNSLAVRFFGAKRMVYFSDFGNTKEYKALQDASKGAGEIKEEDKLEARTSDIYTKAGTAISKKEADFKTEMEKADKDYQKKTDAKLATEKPEPKDKKGAIDKNSADWKKWKEEHDKIWGEIAVYQQEAAQLKGELTKDFGSERADMYSLRDTAVTQLRSAFDARQKVQDKVTDQVKKIMKEEVSNDDAELETTAHFAEDLADDGNLTSGSNQVRDYLSSAIGGKRELKDSEVEDIAMGIATVLHDPSREKDPANPARLFIKGLAQREESSADFISLRGAGCSIKDVQKQILQNLEIPAGTRDEYQAATADPAGAGALIAEIASNEELPAALRGMLLGKLASGNKGTRDEVMKDVKTLFEQAKLVGKDASGAIAKGTFEWGDDVTLEKASAVFLALGDGLKIKKFGDVVSVYEKQKSLIGESPTVQKIIDDAKSPAQMMLAMEPLNKAIKEAETKFREEKVAEIKADPKLKEVEDLYESYGLKEKSPYAAIVADIEKSDEKSPKSLTEFLANLAEFKELTTNFKYTDEILKAANEKRVAANEKIARVQEYQALCAKNKTLTAIGATYTPIDSLDPAEIKAAVDALGTLEADNTTAEEYFEKQEDAKKASVAASAPRVGGAGRGAGGPGGGGRGGSGGSSGGAPSAGPGGSAEPVASGEEEETGSPKSVKFSKLELSGKKVGDVFDTKKLVKNIGLTDEQKVEAANVPGAKGAYADVIVVDAKGKAKRYAAHVNTDGKVDGYYRSKEAVPPQSDI